MRNHPLISVIVPVFNAELYIGNCISSILSQTFSDFEIILVDDGSKDGSGSICDSFATEHANIISLHKKNDGPNSARAYGLSAAGGEWITFVDCDDTIPEKAFEYLLAGASDETDIVVGFSWENKEPVHTVGIEEWRRSLIRSDIVLCVPWGKLYRRRVLSENAFSLITDNRTGTDMPMNIKVAYSTEKPVTIVPNVVYNYVVLNNSVSHSARWPVEKLNKLYSEVVNSIPEYDRGNVMDKLIENRLLAIRRKRTTEPVSNREPLQGTPYFAGLVQDLGRFSYKLGFIEYLLVHFPDAAFTALSCKAARYCMILKDKINSR